MNETTYCVSKTYGAELGISCCYRQWRAKSHCAQMHGYALAFTLYFQATELDENGWVIDFGGLKPIKAWLIEAFDHATLVARDDPERWWYEKGALMGVLTLRTVDRTGCEAIAELVHAHVASWLISEGLAPRVRLMSVEVREHGANGAAVAHG
jgi:6-pyruvoyltetrahydropterin/6-carboxytetrahydropterin synthase